MAPCASIATRSHVWHNRKQLTVTEGLQSQRERLEMERIPWQDVVLLFAADTTRSEWQRAKSMALERTDDGGLARESDAITEEHLLALSELFHEDSCVNWTPTTVGARELNREQIDWAGFELEHALITLRPGTAVLWVRTDGVDITATVAGAPDEADLAEVGVRVPIRHSEGSAFVSPSELIKI